MKIFLFNQGLGVDYLADMIIGGLLDDPSITVYTNEIPEHQFIDYSQEDSLRLYGKGYTITRKFDVEFKSRAITVHEDYIEHMLSQKVFDLIVYSSVRRKFRPPHRRLEYKHPESPADFFDIVIKYYDKNEIIAFDGEDDNDFLEAVVPHVTYYKRELLPKDCTPTLYQKILQKAFNIKYSPKAYPVSFSFPRYWNIDLDYLDYPKEYLLAPCDPRNGASYIYNTEKEYYKQYSKSLFGFTKKKAGWDCMRHYEILGAGIVPYFEDIESKPSSIMQTWPVELQIRANQLYDRLNESYPDNNISKLSDEEFREWRGIQMKFQNWFENYGMTNIYSTILKKVYGTHL